MKQTNARQLLSLQLVIGILVVVGIFSFIMFWGAIPGHALPEYANRTGEPCATCHVSPGGGGPRTLRGLLWASKGKPDKVPDLAGVMAAPGVTDGGELYDIACAACHGHHGEGLFGVELVNTGISADKIRAQILSGKIRSGMPSFDGKFTPDQLTSLTQFVADMASGAATPVPDSYPLEPGRLVCVPSPDNLNCGGN
ncbi:MAG: cytochrome c [Chloroflexota bacterium]